MRNGSTGKIGLFAVVVLVLLGLFFASQADAAGLKKVVAVSRFENKTSYGGGGQWDCQWKRGLRQRLC